MSTTSNDVVEVSAVPPIGHAEAMRLQAAELERAIDLLSSLPPAAWSARTDCPDWDVRTMYLHVLGACEAGAGLVENARQMRAAKRHRARHGGPLEAGLSAVQIDARRGLDPAQLVDRLATVAPATVKGRTRMPSLVRRVKIAVDGPVVEKWSLGYLVDVIYLRDLWMHRVDASRATGSGLVLDADHDGRIVAEVVAEWARRHGQPFELHLTGPAGGRFRAGADGDRIELDAVEFCRVLAGRGTGQGLLATVVPF